MENKFKIVSTLLLMSCFCFNSLMSIGFKSTIGSDNTQVYTQSIKDHPDQSSKVFNVLDSEHDLLLENELEDTKKQLFPDIELNIAQRVLQIVSAQASCTVLKNVQKPLSLNILYCVLNI